MQGVVFLGSRQLEMQTFPDPVPGPNEVVLEIKASGMCGSDLVFYRAKDGAASLGLGDGGIVIGGQVLDRSTRYGSSLSWLRDL